MREDRSGLRCLRRGSLLVCGAERRSSPALRRLAALRCGGALKPIGPAPRPFHVLRAGAPHPRPGAAWLDVQLGKVCEPRPKQRPGEEPRDRLNGHFQLIVPLRVLRKEPVRGHGPAAALGVRGLPSGEDLVESVRPGSGRETRGPLGGQRPRHRGGDGGGGGQAGGEPRRLRHRTLRSSSPGRKQPPAQQPPDGVDPGFELVHVLGGILPRRGRRRQGNSVPLLAGRPGPARAPRRAPRRRRAAFFPPSFARERRRRPRVRRRARPRPRLVAVRAPGPRRLDGPRTGEAAPADGHRPEPRVLLLVPLVQLAVRRCRALPQEQLQRVLEADSPRLVLFRHGELREHPLELLQPALLHDCAGGGGGGGDARREPEHLREEKSAADLDALVVLVEVEKAHEAARHGLDRQRYVVAGGRGLKRENHF